MKLKLICIHKFCHANNKTLICKRTQIGKDEEKWLLDKNVIMSLYQNSINGPFNNKF